MQEMPSDTWPESTLGLLRDGYTFISKRCDELGSDVFRARLLLQPAICMRGAAAARLFYNPEVFQRSGAAPGLLKQVLFGEGGVQGLDGAAHRHRKAMFLGLMTPENIDRLVRFVLSEWRAVLAGWEEAGWATLHDAVREVLFRAVCAWAGVPLKDSEAGSRARDIGALIDDTGAFGPRYWLGKWARKRCEDWIGRSIAETRFSGGASLSDKEALKVVALHRDPNGDLLPLKVAAVELINILRPTVAVGRYITFAALALHQYPEERDRLAAGEDAAIERFAQEVRRFYPFFPFVAARVKSLFNWRGYDFPAGTRVLLDLYGTNHDPRIWGDPERFRPDRFREWQEDPYTFIPQGGGDFPDGHRCPGEWIAIALTKAAVRFLMFSMEYVVPEQDLRVRLSRMPAKPESGFVMALVRGR